MVRFSPEPPDPDREPIHDPPELPDRDPGESWESPTGFLGVGHISNLSDEYWTKEEIAEYQAKLKRKIPLGFVAPLESRNGRGTKRKKRQANKRS